MHVLLGIIVLFLAGTLISSLGAMSGLGGGFMAVPFLMLCWGMDSEAAVIASLTMILANSGSGSLRYFREKMVDLRVFSLLILPTLPGLFLGWFILSNIGDDVFSLLFSLLMITVTVLILIRNHGKSKGRRETVEKVDGMRYIPILSVPVAFAAGIASSAFGIGGGALLMPLQVGLMRMQVKRAIATSMLMIATMSGFRILVVSYTGFDAMVALPLAAGALVGAQIGAAVVVKVKGRYLLYLLSVFLIFIALYLGARSFVSLV